MGGSPFEPGQSTTKEEPLKNPYRHLRELCGTTQKDFAAKHGMSKTTMTYIESGQYPTLSDYQIEALGKECYDREISAKFELREAYGQESLQDAYRAWQTTERMQEAHRFQRVLPTAGTVMPSVSPMAQFIVDSARTTQSFCKLLKVPSATVLRYATGATRSMPIAIRTALEEVRYPYMAELLANQDIWHSATQGKR